MTDDVSLDAFLDRYERGALPKKELEGAIFEYILKNRRRFYLQDFEKGECIDFLSWFYPRLSRAIGHYRNAGASFTAYVTSMVRYSAREYQRREMEHRIVEHIYWEAASEEFAVHSREPVYLGEVEPPPAKIREPVNNPRQVLILLLKSYSFISDEFILQAAPAVGLSGDALLRMVDELRHIRFEHDAEVRGFRDRIYCQFFRCKTFERRRNAAPEGSTQRTVLQHRLERAKSRLANMQKYYKTIKVGASNQQIARLLNIPKGTVDSNLFAAKSGIDEDEGGDPAPAGKRRRRR
jgi:DNA-directed RNA polymerase specialized sigma24 family protein